MNFCGKVDIKVEELEETLKKDISWMMEIIEIVMKTVTIVYA